MLSNIDIVECNIRRKKNCLGKVQIFVLICYYDLLNDLNKTFCILFRSQTTVLQLRECYI